VKVSRSVILDVTVDVVVPTALLVALYFLFVGHNAPGGGFIGGLVAGGALVLRELTGRPARGVLTRLDPLAVMGIGLVLAAGTGMASWLTGNDLFESGYLSIDVPVLGTVKAFSVLAFDTGVFCVVVGLVLAELAALGPEGDDDAVPGESTGEPAP
jgi:multisubunit Na+/H+ antiporter MnhB subunit